MTIPDSVARWGAVALFVALLAVLAVAGFKKMAYDDQVTALQNALADKAHTLEVHQGVYEKLAVESENLKALLDASSKQVQQMTFDLDRAKAQLLTANNLVITWKRAYEGLADANQHPDPTNPERITVDFHKDFGYLDVDGHTTTNPPEAFVRVRQNRPLALTLVVGQDSDGTWKSHVTSSEENIDVDIKLAAVNVKMFDPKWYQKIGVAVDVGVGGTGFLGGAGLSYGFGNVEVGPKVWMQVGSNGVVPYYGAGLSWRPWQ